MFSFLWRQSVYWHDKNGVHMMMRHGYTVHMWWFEEIRISENTVTAGC